MSGDRIAQFVFYGVALTLPLSALITRRLPLGRTLRLVAIWAVIIVAAVLLVNATRDGASATWARLRAALADGDQRTDGGTVRLRKADDGHFWATASIDGVERRLLVDSGASATALSVATAKAAGLDPDGSTFPAVIETANGRIIARVVTVKRLAIGGIVARDLSATVAPAYGETDVLGMNFLSRLRSWHVDGDVLVMEE